MAYSADLEYSTRYLINVITQILDRNIPVFGLMEIGIFIGIFGIVCWTVLGSLSKWNMIPMGDPYLEESLELHT